MPASARILARAARLGSETRDRLDACVAWRACARDQVVRFGSGEREVEPVLRQVLGAGGDLGLEAERRDFGAAALGIALVAEQAERDGVLLLAGGDHVVVAHALAGEFARDAERLLARGHRGQVDPVAAGLRRARLADADAL